MRVEIKSRWTGSVIFECDIEAGEDTSLSVRLGLAVRKAVEAKANLRGANLSGADLSEANLSEADLSWANLRGAYLSEANLRGANLSGAYLSEANLRGANLIGANLSEADLSGADLSGAYLSEANLRGADLSGANLRGAYLIVANLREANLLSFGNMRELRTMQIGKWLIGYTADTLQIGCQRHAIEKWRKWDSEAGRKWIAQMDSEALEWAERNLALVLAIIDANPATPTGREGAK